MRLLFIHQSLPSQFQHLLIHYGQRNDCEVVGLVDIKQYRANFKRPVPGVRLVSYAMPTRTVTQISDVAYATEEAIRRGHAVLTALLTMKKSGFVPDVVYAHPGWGETLFLKDAFPNTRLIHLCEFYFRISGQDFGFDPEFPPTADDVIRLRTRNLHHLMAMDQADLGIAPTNWQRTCFPSPYQPKIEVAHEGIDTDRIKPSDKSSIDLTRANIRLSRLDEIITFASRSLEPYRGFHTFMRALPRLLRERPSAHVLIIGGEEATYGRQSEQCSFKEKYLSEMASEIDLRRVHFLGRIPHASLIRIFQISTAHIYLTYPFILSWSMLEAMAAGCVVIGSRTAPVEEVVTHGLNGLLVDFFSPDQITDAVVRACEAPDRLNTLRHNARQTVVNHFDVSRVCLPRQIALIET